MATEEPSQACKLTTAKQAPAPSVFYHQGVCSLPELLPGMQAACELCMGIGHLVTRSIACVPQTSDDVSVRRHNLSWLPAAPVTRYWGTAESHTGTCAWALPKLAMSG